MTRAGLLTAACLTAACALAACGASSHPTAKAHGKLPRRARVLFASDAPATSHRVLGSTPSGQVLASLGFNPSVNGFSFENYGFIAGTELDAHAMRELFGDGVCQGAPSDTCTLTYPAQQWAQQAADSMSGGHCFGFSVTALRFFTGNLSPSQFGASSTFGLQVSPTLQSEIAYGWATQLLPDVGRTMLAGPPTGILHFLERALANHSGEDYTIGIHNGNEGHAVTPIAVANEGSGKYGIEIYDNNYPGITRTISIDTNSDSWSYEAAPNPSQHSDLYQGQGSTNPIVLIPLSSELRPHPCPFCSTGTAPAHRMVTVSLGGNPDQHGHLLITTPSGAKLGFSGGRFVNQIKGARVIHPFLDQDWKAHPEPIYEIPASGPLHVTLQGRGATGRDRAAVHLTGPGFGATVSNLLPSARTVDSIVLGGGGSSLTLSSSGASGPAPTVILAKMHGQSSGLTSATPKAFGASAGVKLAVGPSGTVKVATLGAAHAAPVSVTVRQAAPSGSQKVQSTAVRPPSGQTQTVPFSLFRAG